MDQIKVVVQSREPWNKGKLVGQKAPLKLKETWAIRIRLQLAGLIQDLALLNLAIDSKLRACDLVKLRVRDVCHGDRVAARAIVMQKRPSVPFSSRSRSRRGTRLRIGSAAPVFDPKIIFSQAACAVHRIFLPVSTPASLPDGCGKSALIRQPTARTRCGARRRP
jgi:hypothetical protein